MSKKKLSEFDEWYNQQVANGVEFNLKEEMVAYCTSHVKLLKAGCQRFQQEFAIHGQLNPMEKCVIIASACNQYWHKKHLMPNTIAVGPPRGWHATKTNQSVKALQWLTWCEHQLHQAASPTDQPTADRIAHMGNEQIVTPARTMCMDGYNATVRTIYEFQGCLWHGCPRCYHK